MGAIDEKVIDIIVDKLGVERSEATPEAVFVDDLGADSLDDRGGSRAIDARPALGGFHNHHRPALI